jgi:3-oxoacyl-[acyl-carrier protein] reductase
LAYSSSDLFFAVRRLDVTGVAFVTGGNRGIGRATAEALQESGHRVVIGSRSGEPIVGFDVVQIDVSDRQSITDACARVGEDFGPITTLVANAGITRDTLLMRMSDEDIDDVLNTNLGGSIRLARACLRDMLKARQGRIVFIGSVVWAVGSGGQVNYAASKAGLVGAARSLAREVGSRGITVNVVAPGFVETDMTAVLDETQRTNILSTIPLGRYASASEIAQVVTFLAGEHASYITGAVIPVDGGLGMGH